MRNVTGQYAGCCKMGASRASPIWYPLSLNCCPTGLSFGHASWHEEHGMPYFLANAGRALAGLQVERNIPRTAATYKRVFTGRLAIRFTPLPPLTSILPPQLRSVKR